MITRGNQHFCITDTGHIQAEIIALRGELVLQVPTAWLIVHLHLQLLLRGETAIRHKMHS